MTPPHLAASLGAWLLENENGLVGSLDWAMGIRGAYAWRDRRGRRSGSGCSARADHRMKIVKLIADIRALRRWRKELAQ